MIWRLPHRCRIPDDRMAFRRFTPSRSGCATKLPACCPAFVEQNRLMELAFLQGPGHNLRQRRSVPRPQHPSLHRLTCGSTRTCLRPAG